MNPTHHKIILEYVNAYNNFDTEGMIEHLADVIHFENRSNGDVTLVLDGKEHFKNQAEQAKGFFSQRKQTILSWVEENGEIIIEVDYHGILAVDLPNGLKKGTEMKLKGQSRFKFKNNQITVLIDES